MMAPLEVRRSAIGPLLRELRVRYREGKAEVGQDQWRKWQRHVLVGIVAMVGLMILLVWIGKQQVAAGKLDWETGFLEWLGENGPLKFYSAVFFQTFSTDITMYIVLSFTVGIAIWNRRPVTGVSIFLAFWVCDLVGRFGWKIWGRARPSVLHDGVASPGFHSFPSGHTAKALCVYGFLVYLWLRHSRSYLEKLIGVLFAMFVAIVVPLGRVTMGVHWPSDVIAGWILGLVWMIILVVGMRYENAARAAR